MAGFVGDRMPDGRPDCFTRRGAAFHRVSMCAVSAGDLRCQADVAEL
jgi:hypothetical protein